MDGINFGLLGDNAFEAYQKFQNADTQKQLNQQQLAQSQQATRLGAARERAMATEAAQQKALAAITQIAGFNTRAAALADLNARRASGELDEPTYARISSKLPADDRGMSKWQLDTLRSLLPAAEQYKALENEQAQAQLDQQFGMGAPAAPAPAPAVTNNLAPVENVNALADKTLPPVPVTAARAPSMPSEEQAARMAGSSHKPTAEAGQRILAFYASQPELSKLQAQKNRLIAMGATNSDPEIREINARINKINTHTPVSYAPVAVVDPSTGKPMYVSRGEAVKGKMTPADAQESLPPKEIQKREAAHPQATAAVKGFESNSDKFIKDLEALRDDPGLNSITGVLYGRTPSVTSAGRRALALYNKVTAKSGFQALQDMRNASKTGGALGNVSNQEGKQLIASYAALDRTQDAKDLRNVINQLISDLEGSKTRLREAYDDTYSYKSQNSPSAPQNTSAAGAPPAGFTVDNK